jgi:hypothetical protein
MEREEQYSADEDRLYSEDLHAKLKRWFEASEEAGRDAFNKMERDVDYYDNKQLTQEEYDKLVSRGQPPITVNLIRRKIDFLLGMEAQNRNDPKAYPRTPQDADSAEVATDALRYVADSNEYSYHRARAWKDILVAGVGGIEVMVKQSRRPPPGPVQKLGYLENNPDIIVKRTPWDRMWWDAHSCEPDFSDCRHRGLVLWMDADDAEDKYEDRKEILAATLNTGSRTDTYDDKPKLSAWCDSNRKRVRIVQCYWKEGDQCYWAEFTEAGILAAGESPWIDTEGESEDPYIWRSAYVDRDNNRHGVVRDMIDPQDEVNKRRSKSLHLLTTNQIIAERGATDDPEETRRKAAQPDAYIEINPGLEFRIEQNNDLSAGQMTLLQHATAELEKMGPNASLQGNESNNSQSGRAIQAKQKGGLVELGPLLDHLRSMDREVFEKVWGRCKQFWQAPMFIRVTDRDDAPKFIGLNEPMIDPQSGQQVGMRNEVAQTDIDLIIEESPDVATIEQEVWADLTQILPMLMQMPPHLQEFVVEASPYPPSRKRKLLEVLKGGNQQPDPAQVQKQQMAEQMQMRDALAETAKKEASAAKDQAQAMKAMAEAGQGQPQEAQMTPMQQQIADVIAQLEARNLAADANVKDTRAELQRAQTFKTMREATEPPQVPQQDTGANR